MLKTTFFKRTAAPNWTTFGMEHP